MKVLVALLSLMLACSGTALAEDFPARTITLVVPAAPGGPSDALARLLAEKLKTSLGQSVVTENRGGANGTIGVNAVVRAKPDGHTVLFSVDGPLTTIPALMRDMPYDAVRDLMPLAIVGDGGDVVLAVPADSPAKTARELATLLRGQPDQSNYVSSGAGFPSHVVGELYKREAKVSAQHVPMKGAGAAMVELLSGRYSFSFPPASLAVLQQRAGKIRVLAVAGEKRNTLFPDVPTLAEAGYPNIAAPGYWIATYVPADTPRPVVDELAASIRAATHAPDFAPLLQAQGMVASDQTPEQIRARLQRESAYWRQTIERLNIRME